MRLRRALELYAEPERWRAVQVRAMTREVGWHASAARYAALYRDLLQPTSAGPLRPLPPGPATTPGRG